jgi:diguanylate cyclase (GGDEF)-like protein
MAGAAARRGWAGQGRLAREQTASSTAVIAHIASLFLLALSAAVVVCALIGLAFIAWNDSRRSVERHAALRLALDEVHAVFGHGDGFENGRLRLIERRAGLKGLRFATEPPATGAREVQSLHDSEGRIIGWFSWEPDRGLARVMKALWVLVAVAGAGLAGGAFVAAGAGLRLDRLLAQTTETVRKLTEEDALTALPSHSAMLKRLEGALASRRSGTVVLALIDLDAFREFKETLGRAGGDAALKQMAEHLNAAVPVGALLGRFEDDEFAVITSSDQAEGAAALDAALRAALSRPILVDRPWQLTATIGLAQAPDDGTTAEELARRAGLALRAARREGRGLTRRFESAIEREHTERQFILRELEAAISRGDLEVHYQPIVAADGSGIVGVEALLRWTHPARGALPRSLFIPLAEQNGLMPRLGEFVLRQAMADGARWSRLFVAVNLSPLQIRDAGFIDLVGAVMAETGIAPSRVVLEVTEGVLIDDPQHAQARLEALHALGVRIALDDFGTGYSSLSYLQRFPFDRVKIDRTFVASLGASGNSGAIIQSIVTLGHALGMKVLGEGVETDEQRVLLRLAGCDELQGHLFAKPAPAAEIDQAWIRPAGPVKPPAVASAR